MLDPAPKLKPVRKCVQTPNPVQSTPASQPPPKTKYAETNPTPSPHDQGKTINDHLLDVTRLNPVA